MQDFRAALAQENCWDNTAEFLWRTQGVPAVDAILQNREELIPFLEWFEAKKIKSYLEIGTWTGRLVSVLHKLFDLDLVAACDLGWAQTLGLPLHLPDDVVFFAGNSHSEEYKRWRKNLGHIDLVFIDGDHSYEGVRRDYEINSSYPHRFLAFHDIVNPHPAIQGVGKLWRELDGYKLEIVRPHLDIGLSESTMGIGIWSQTESPYL